ncbi:light-independent protochlorophyllide reductase, n subunit [Heliomicrobium modesticaldum Ice1]|uniref:Light-independent protochlorophyllide reductase subunit N n=1 Tax=Heliobacterium modesticaldum (strain ATCC 51547 / Ice1) TaxID=498761 RepID=BCHN_HELMI|nr:ferredoxin:protochlorophyllide reductase (ATP-dependent) subunit N [Heliomicrobium modesticaldum]B0TBM7.1 RecName: Full=Light-independent protochlorophyllide reductase subunit N; Short=DPOR subunit N; Short=LI-POR subunit N [Heliomicrobium modesticaldum Ice1]ABZ83866.1 light-independent protochlorophyllide reductase, n subunit [Heliomicrobium modesticaldum Ice1]
MEGIERENGCFHTFCPIASVAWLHRKIKDSFFLIVGTHTCAHFIQTALDVMVYAHSRFGFAVLEESDLVAASPTAELAKVVEDIKAEWQPKVIFLLSTCSCDILKLDLENSSKDLTIRFGFPVVPVQTSGLDRTFTQGEDAVLHALLPFVPKEDPKVAVVEEKKRSWFSFGKDEGNKASVPAAPTRNLVLVGAVTDSTTQQLQWELKQLGLERVDVFPSGDITNMPVINEHTVIVPLQPYLSDTLATLRRERGAKVLTTLLPIGPDGTARFLEAICAEFGLDASPVAEREAQTWRSLESQRALLRGKRIMFLGDNLLEIPLARFLTACGAEVVEAGTPYVHAKDLSEEIARLREKGVPIVESPNFSAQVERIDRLRPDLIVAGLGICNPLEAAGYTTAWSIEFTFAQIHGFVNAIDLIKLFVKPLLKRQALLEQGWTEAGWMS